MNFVPSAIGPRLLFALLLLICASALAGCNRGNPMYQVSGKVLYKDGSVPKAAIAQVLFEPTPGSTATVRRSAQGEINPEDGSFTLWTRKPGDGVFPGEYSVAFGLFKGAMDTKSLLPDKYSFGSQSPYKITVDGNKRDLSYEIEPLPGKGGGAAPAK